MEGVEECAEDGLHHNNPNNIYVELNNQPSELLQTVKDLKVELQNVKEDNERILRAHEELNQILMDKLHNDGKDKRKKLEYEYGTISYKCKGKKLKFSNNESNSSSRSNVRSHRKKNINIPVKVVIVTIILKRENINLMKKSQKSLRR